MRGSLGALGLILVLWSAGNAAAFDRPQCDELRRRVDNADLARRISSNPPGGDLECLVRIAAVRLSAVEDLYLTQSPAMLRTTLQLTDLGDLEDLDSRRAIAGRLRAAVDPFATDALYRASLVTPARNNLFAQLNSGDFPDAQRMLAERAPTIATLSVGEVAPEDAPAEGTAVAAVAAPPEAPADVCLTAEGSGDPDLLRNAEALDGLCIRRSEVADGDARFAFVAIENEAHADGPVWFVPHDDENAAFDAALHAVRTYGGKLVAVAGAETREVAGVDPNRIFAATDAAAAGCEAGRAFPNYTAFVAATFAGSKEILTAHNNTDGGPVSVKVRTDKLRGWQVRRGKFRDPDDLVYVAGTTPYNRSREARRLRDRLLGAGLNVVYEYVTAKNNDCSLSNWAMLNGKRPYFNIEAEDDATVQNDMVDSLMRVLGYRKVDRGGHDAG